MHAISIVAIRCQLLFFAFVRLAFLPAIVCQIHEGSVEMLQLDALLNISKRWP